MTNFWLNDPSILLNKEHITEIWPSSNMSSIQKLNAMTRLVFLLTLLGFLISKTFKVLITGFITLCAIILLHYFQNKQLSHKDNNIIKEGYINSSTYNNNKDAFYKSTENNPLMNLMPNQILEEPNREPAAPTFLPEVKNNINENTKKMISNNFDNNKDIEEKLFKDLGDSIEFDNSMRNWYATPNTQNPNDQDAFANYCYGDMKSIKEYDEI